MGLLSLLTQIVTIYLKKVLYKEKASMFLPYEAPDGADFFREKYTYVCIINLLLSYIVCMSYHI